MTKTAAVFGSTGLVGTELVKELRKHSAFSKIYSYARRPPMFLGDKTHFKPFETDNFSLSEDVDVVFCALGTTIKKAGSKNDFREVDLTAVKRIADQARHFGVKQLLVVSSVGADAQSNNFYLRTKGEMEEAVKDTGIPQTVFFRPSLLLGKRNEKRIAEDIGKIIITPLRFLMIGKIKQYRPIEAQKVAKAMIYSALNPQNEISVIENKNIFAISGKY